MAFQYWQHRGRGTKRAFVSLAEAYHGDTIGAVSVGGIGVFHAIFGPLLFDGFRIPTPHGYRAPELDGEQLTERSLTALEQLLEQHADEVAAVIMEPLVQGAAGIIVHPRGFLGGVAKLCREHGVLLILDEVATGFGRTGTMFACEQEAVAPDLMCLAKGITGGYLPLAATLTTEEVFDAFLAPQVEGKQFFHGHTYTGNPIACAAALASLDIFERDGTLVRVRTRASELASALRERVAGLPVVGEVRQRGLMIGIELAADGPTRRPFSPQRLAGIKVCARAREHGVILRPLGDVIVLMPPLSMSAEEGELLVSAVADAIQDELL
jgi:adenosylmethionine-8-amino-7-oxononanoate aminotransferase